MLSAVYTFQIMHKICIFIFFKTYFIIILTNCETTANCKTESHRKLCTTRKNLGKNLRKEILSKRRKIKFPHNRCWLKLIVLINSNLCRRRMRTTSRVNPFHSSLRLLYNYDRVYTCASPTVSTGRSRRIASRGPAKDRPRRRVDPARRRYLGHFIVSATRDIRDESGR